MRYAILGDIHSNLTALEVVLAEMDQLSLLEEIQKLGLGPRIEMLEAYLRGDLPTEDEEMSP